LFISKLLATRKTGFDFKSFSEISSFISSPRIFSMFTPCCAETGIIGEFSAIVPLRNSFISL
jgi:hypothetical protein